MDKKELTKKFFPEKESRVKAAEAIATQASSLLSRYPQNLVQQVQKLKASGLSLREIYDALGQDLRIPEIAMHLAVKNQAEEIGES